MNKITIKNVSGIELFSNECENNNVKLTVVEAMRVGANLRYANLRYADLDGANLRYADLNGADLNGADLNGADLNGANLRYANLHNADLRNADLHNADLRYADLNGADLNGARLVGADLNGANLNGEILTKTPIQISGMQWFVLITKCFMSIGCKRYSHADWASFNDETISEMDDKALAFWNLSKESLLMMCANHSNEV